MNKQRFWLILPLLVALGLALAPSVARADMILPALVYMLSWLHLMIGNLLIGLAEGWLIARVFKTKLEPSVLFMLAANYFSGWVGYFAVQHWRDAYNIALIERFPYIKPMIWIAWAALFTGTLLLEWPFCFLVFRKSGHRWLKSLKALLLSQSASYAVLLILYLSASDMSLITRTKPETSLDFAKTSQATVYYISPQGDALWRRRLDGSAPEKMATFDAKDMIWDVRIMKSEDGKGRDVWLHRRPDNTDDYWELVLRNLREPVKSRTIKTTKSMEHLVSENIEAIQAREPQDELIVRGWDDRTGITIYRKDKTTTSLALQTPMAVWQVLPFAHLPGGQAVLELGVDEKPFPVNKKPFPYEKYFIALLDMHSMQLGVIARGYFPVVNLE